MRYRQAQLRRVKLIKWLYYFSTKLEATSSFKIIHFACQVKFVKTIAVKFYEINGDFIFRVSFKNSNTALR